MGDITNFKVNDDGSVTVGNPLTREESNILDIFKIEKAKGGLFASHRMKKRALEYAKSVGIPNFTVEKLFLENYSEDFAIESNLTSLIIGYVTLFGGFICLICCIAMLIEDYDYYIKFQSGDFNRCPAVNQQPIVYDIVMLAGGIFGVLVGITCLLVSRNKNKTSKKAKYSIKY